MISKDMISVDLSDETVAILEQKMDEMAAELPFLINLTTQQRRAIQKLGDRTVSFVDKTLEYSKKRRDINPPYLDVAEFEKDYLLWRKLFGIKRQLESLLEGVTDTYMEAGAEAFAAARMFYEAIKSAAKSSVPGTDVIAAELKKRYYYTKSVKNEEPVETPEVTGSTN